VAKGAKKKPGFLYRRAQLKGLLGGSRPWTLVWGVLFARRMIKRLVKDEPEILFRTELKPGEALIISGKEGEPRVVPGP
jgi:hypothetical protein